MEFCNRGDLQNLIKRAKDKQVSGLKEAVIWNISLQIVLGLHYLHRKKILHRDLKSANVFLMKEEDTSNINISDGDSSSSSSCKKKKTTNSNYSVKIGDLGVAKLMDTSTAFANTIVGTPYYLSPELCADMPYRGEDVLPYSFYPSIHPYYPPFFISSEVSNHHHLLILSYSTDKSDCWAMGVLIFEVRCCCCCA